MATTRRGETGKRGKKKKHHIVVSKYSEDRREDKIR